jgi:L-threonylcarbamoyladenylate synthase
MTQIVKADQLNDETIAKIAAAVKGCKIIVFPTDTVYGIGSTGLVKAAARRIYQIKERPSIKPLPTFVHSLEAAKKWVEWTPLADALAKRFWPGKLTLVLKHTREGELLTFPEYRTIAIRVPDNAIVLKLIEASGVPWVQTSANRSGQPSLVDGAEAARTFDGVADWIIDAGKAPGTESTIVDATGDKPIVLREGAIKASEILSAGVPS